MSIGSIQQFPLFGFKTEQSCPKETHRDRLKFNAWRVSSYIPIISWVGASIKLWESAKIVFKVIYCIFLMGKRLLSPGLTENEKKIKLEAIKSLIDLEFDELKRVKEEAVKKIGEESPQAADIRKKLAEIADLCSESMGKLVREMSSGEKRLDQTYQEMKNIKERLASKTAEFYTLCGANFAVPQAESWIDALQDYLGVLIGLTADQMAKIEEVNKEYTLQFIASLARTLFFEVLPIGWLLLPVDLYCTAWKPSTHVQLLEV